MNHIPVNQLLAVYALGACEQAESAAIEAHLGSCPACYAEVRPLQAAADWLGVAVPTAPPASLKARVLQRARALPSAGDHEVNQGSENSLIQGVDPSRIW